MTSGREIGRALWQGKAPTLIARGSGTRYQRGAARETRPAATGGPLVEENQL